MTSSSESPETGFDEGKYIPLLTPRQYLNNSDSENENEDENEDEHEITTRNTYKRKRKSTRTIQELPQLPSDFNPFIHPKQPHRASVRLLTYLNVGVSKLIDFFFLFFTTNMLDNIIENTNLYALSKDAGATGRH